VIVIHLKPMFTGCDDHDYKVLLEYMDKIKDDKSIEQEEEEADRIFDRYEKYIDWIEVK